MNIIEKSESIRAGLRKGPQDGTSKMARRRCAQAARQGQKQVPGAVGMANLEPVFISVSTKYEDGKSSQEFVQRQSRFHSLWKNAWND